MTDQADDRDRQTGGTKGADPEGSNGNTDAGDRVYARKGHRGFLPGNPGRKPKKGGDSMAPVNNEADLLAGLLKAVRKRGQRFFDDLAKEQPLQAAKLIECLTRRRDEDAAPTNVIIRTNVPPPDTEEEDAPEPTPDDEPAGGASPPTPPASGQGSDAEWADDLKPPEGRGATGGISAMAFDEHGRPLDGERGWVSHDSLDGAFKRFRR